MAVVPKGSGTVRSDGPASPPLFGPEAMNIPNLITVCRLILAIVLFVLIDYEGLWITAAVVFVVAAATDALDGFIARRYGMVTTLGRILDPFVDKIIVCGAFIFLLEKPQASGVTAWMVVVIVGREMFVTGLRSFLERAGCDFSATWSGKLKMGLQSVAVTASLLSLSPHLAEAWFLAVRDVLLWAAVLVTAWSGGVYMYRAAVMMKGGLKDSSGADAGEPS